MIAANTQSADRDTSPPATYDAIIIGGGPAGATAALQLARAGRNVLVLERSEFPRFQIGESFLPRGYQLLRELGLLDEVLSLPHVDKFGAEFGMGGDLETTRFNFAGGLVLDNAITFNIARAPFDALLLDQARKAGAVVRERASVRKIVRLADGDVAVGTDAGEVRGRYLLDASGQATVVGRHLNTRRRLPDSHLHKVAYFGHFKNVKRLAGQEEGHPLVAMCDEGWFWVIPLDETTTSIGLVLRPEIAKRLDLPTDRVLRWGIERCPLVLDRVRDAVWPDEFHVRADFSYRCEPYAGPGYFLLGDAATFLDPVFSTGVCLGMYSGVRAAAAVDAILAGRVAPERARREYTRVLKASSAPFFRIIGHYYNHRFRELFLHGHGPYQIHKAVLAVLAGSVFPKPVFGLSWRLRLFELFITVHRFFPLVAPRARFSLLASRPREIAKPAGTVAGAA